MENLIMYIGIAIAVIIITLFVLVIQMRSRIKALTQGKKGVDLEGIIQENNRAIQLLQEHQQEHHKLLTGLGHDFRKSIQKIGIVRFNPFKETGGNQSFALALVDQEHNGVVITSLYSRERLNVFAKPITKGQSSYQLSQEEEAALKEALASN